MDRVHLDVLRYLYDALPEDESVQDYVSRKVLFKSVNFKPRQIEKACNELEAWGYVRFQLGFYKKEWSSIAITDSGMDYAEGLVD